MTERKRVDCPKCGVGGPFGPWPSNGDTAEEHHDCDVCHGDRFVYEEDLLSEINQLKSEVAEHESELEKKRVRLAQVTREGFGVTGIRDPEHPCTAFVEGVPDRGGDCETDGHYVCDECTRRMTCEGCGHRPIHCECPGGQYGPTLEFEVPGLKLLVP